jgi:hypothetical protein
MLGTKYSIFSMLVNLLKIKRSCGSCSPAPWRHGAGVTRRCVPASISVEGVKMRMPARPLILEPAKAASPCGDNEHPVFLGPWQVAVAELEGNLEKYRNAHLFKYNNLEFVKFRET